MVQKLQNRGYYYQTTNLNDGTTYNIRPSAFGAKELKVTTPEVVVTAPRKRTYSSAFNPTAAFEPVHGMLDLMGKAFGKATDATGTTKAAQTVMPWLMPSQYIGWMRTGNRPGTEGNTGFGESKQDQCLNEMFDLGTSPALMKGVGKVTKPIGKTIVEPINNTIQNIKKNINRNDVTSNFLKFTGGNGKPQSPAIPRTQAQIEMYGMLKKAGVDMNKIGIEDINKALQLREEALLSSGKSFSYQQPVTPTSEIIYSIDDGVKTGFIDLRKPFLTNDRGFASDVWESYKNNPRKKGLGVGMVENYTQTVPNKYSRIIKGIQERLTNSAIDVAKQQGYEGVVSGETLLSPERTVKMYPKYKHKRVIDQNGRYHWQNHNPGMSEQPGPVYMLKEPTYSTITKSQVFDPRIINKKGKMKINWKKGRTLFNSIAIPTTFSTYLFATQE